MLTKIDCCNTTKVLPLVYDNSLSYEEQICKIIYYLNNHVVSDDELKETLNYINSVTIKSVSGILGYGSVLNPIDLKCLGLEDYTCLYFSRGTYFVKGVDIDDLEHLTFLMPEATIMCVDEWAININNGEHFTLIGGCFNGRDIGRYGVQLKNCKNSRVINTTFTNFGNANVENTMGLGVFGDCTGFNVNNCTFKNITAGVQSSDGFIHSYGILINRLGSTQEYSKTGTVNNCNFDNIASMDTTRKGDGDGIFIQAPPYIDSSGKVVKPQCKVEINECYFNNCKKRAVKVATFGSKIKNCYMDGEYWFACIDAQYGSLDIENCALINKSDYNGSITSAVIFAFGDCTIKNCKISAPYTYINPDDESKKDTFHPGIRFDSRHGTNIIPASEKWGDIVIDNCLFDGVSRGVLAYDSNQNPPTYAVSGLYITDCTFGEFNQAHCIDIGESRFSSIDVFSFTNFRLLYGDDRFEVAEKIDNVEFKYPLGIGVPVKLSMSCYSNYWLNEPVGGYNKLHNTPHGKIVYSGDNMGDITYQEHTGHGTISRGKRNPADITTTLAKQLLYNSKIGDIFINTSNGNLFTCTVAGDDTSIGTWTQR